MKPTKLAEDVIRQHASKFQFRKERWLEFVERYENKIREGSITAMTEAKAGIGGAYSLVENTLVRILNRQPRFRYLARNRNAEPAVELYDEFARYQSEVANLRRHYKTIARWGCVTGLAGWVMGWKTEKTVVKKRGKEFLGRIITNPTMVEVADKLRVGKNIVVDDEETISNYTVTPISPFNLVWDVNAESPKDAKVMGYSCVKSVAQLKADGYDVSKIHASMRANIDYWKDRLNKEDQNTLSLSEMDNQFVRVVQTYVTHTKNGMEKNTIVTTAGYGEGDTIQLITIDERENPLGFVPMGIFRPIDRLSKFYGFGMIEPAVGSLDAEEDSFNMGLEVLWTDLSRPMEFNPNNLLRPEELKFRPRTLIPVRQLGQSVSVLQTPVLNTNALVALTDFAKRATQNTSGITDFQTGSENLKGAKTLGEIQIKTQESSARIQGILDNFEEQVIQPIGRMALKMNKLYLDNKNKTIFRVLGKKGILSEKGIKFNDIDAIKDVVVVSGSSAIVSQQEEIQKWTLLLNQANGEKGLGPNGVPVNTEEIWKRLLESGYMIKDLETFLPSLKDREKEAVQGDVAQLQDAKSENQSPMTARVLPTDNPQVHIPIHQAGVREREQELSIYEQKGQQPPQSRLEELQLLITHLNDHTTQAGGTVSQPEPPIEVPMEAQMQPVSQPNE